MSFLDKAGLTHLLGKLTSALSTKADLVNGKVPASQLPANFGGGSGGGGSVSNTMTVTFDFDLATMKAKNPSHTAMEIVEAYRNGYTVQGSFVYSVSDGINGNILVPLSMVVDAGVYGIAAFNTTILVSGVVAYISVEYSSEVLNTAVKPLATLS